MVKKEKKKKEEFAEVLIPVSIFKKIEERIKGTGFPSVPSYVTYILREVLTEEEGEEEKSFTKEDEEKIKARLRALGYID
jgi:6-phosphofructokinase